MDKEAIRKALDHFENDEYVDAQDIIKKEIAGSRDIFLKNKIGLKNDISPMPDTDASKTDDQGAKDDDDQQGDE